MKNLELKNFNVQEMNVGETTNVNGGSEFSEAVFRAIGYSCHKISDAINAVDWNNFYSHAFQYTQ